MISNKKQSSRALLLFTGIWAALLILFALSFSEVITIPVWSQLAILGLIAISGSFFYLGGFFYIQIEVENNKNLMVKHYNLFPIGRKFKAFKIPLQQVHRHEIKGQLWGLIHWLTIYQKMKGGIAKYPAVGLSATSKKERTEINNYLSSLEGRSK
ncbi:hypothetical protein ACT29H_07690 [Thermophagus sp. OGC60D27]|uniref:hypothetical protein n=1 Tax=Thermophagus sp. OGC60D27 TaxID=3458415 RepID=UPI00403767A7